jgi:hypothetical protein
LGICVAKKINIFYIKIRFLQGTKDNDKSQKPNKVFSAQAKAK